MQRLTVRTTTSTMSQEPCKEGMEYGENVANMSLVAHCTGIRRVASAGERQR